MNDFQHLCHIISSIVNLKQTRMDLSIYLREMSSLKYEFSSNMSKSTSIDIGTSQLNTDSVHDTYSHSSYFDNFREQILTGPIVPTFDEVLAQLLHHPSNVTQSLLFASTSNTSLLVSQPNS